MGKELREYNSSRITKRHNRYLSHEFEDNRDDFDLDSTDEINIKEYLDIILKRKWLVLACVLISLITVAISTYKQVPLYRAFATMEMSPRAPKFVAFDNAYDSTNRYRYINLDSFYSTQFKLIKSKNFGKKVVDALNLGLPAKQNVNSNNSNKSNNNSITDFVKANISEILFGKKIVNNKQDATVSEENVVEVEQKINDTRKAILASSFLSGLNLYRGEDSDIVTVSYTSHDPDFAAKATNTVIDEYVKFIVERKQYSTKQAKEFLSTQLDQAKLKLEKAEQNLALFAKSIDVVTLDKDLNLIYTQLAELNSALSSAETDKLDKKALYDQINSGNYKYLPQVVNDDSMVDIRTEYTSLKSEYNNLQTIYGPNYPQLKRLKAQIDGVEREISRRQSAVIQSIKSEYLSSVKKEKILRERLDIQNKKVADLNDKSVNYKILKREVDTNKSIYENLLQRLKETEVTSASDITNVQVLDYALVPSFPFQPNMKRNLSIGLFVGLMVGCLLAFVLNLFDNTIKDEEEVKNKFPLPFLGTVPLLFENTTSNIEKAVLLNPKSQIAEAFRVIRTSLLYSVPNFSPKSMLVTSTQPLEGKTTAASNLALTITQTGGKVMIVDADLRKPRIHKLYINNGKKAYGLSSFLTGDTPIESIIHKTDLDNMDIIPSGPIPNNPAELLGSNRMKILIDELHEKYDHIILDGAPISGFADSRLLSRYVDGVLLVTSVGITQKTVLRNSIEEIKKLRGRILGTIVNRYESKKGRYGYNYYYYYNEDNDEKARSKGLRSLNS